MSRAARAPSVAVRAGGGRDRIGAGGEPRERGGRVLELGAGCGQRLERSRALERSVRLAIPTGAGVRAREPLETARGRPALRQRGARHLDLAAPFLLARERQRRWRRCRREQSAARPLRMCVQVAPRGDEGEALGQRVAVGCDEERVIGEERGAAGAGGAGGEAETEQGERTEGREEEGPATVSTRRDAGALAAPGAAPGSALGREGVDRISHHGVASPPS